MALWSSEKCKLQLPRKHVILPYFERNVKHGAYELSMGPEAFITSTVNDTKQTLEMNEQLVIPPGQFGLLLTEEKVTIPDDVIGFISIKASIKFRGLVNVSGFHVDSCFSGRLKFSVYNAGSQKIILSRGQPVFLIWFNDLDQPTKDVYKGEHNNQDAITSDDVMLMQGKVVSPVVLDERLTTVEHNITIIKAIGIGILFTLVGLFAKSCIDRLPEPSKQSVQEGQPNKPVQQMDEQKRKEGKAIENSVAPSSDIKLSSPKPTGVENPLNKHEKKKDEKKSEPGKGSGTKE